MCNPKTRQEGDYTLTLLTNGGFILNKDFIAKHWYASMYEQTENQTNDVDFCSTFFQQKPAEHSKQSLKLLVVEDAYVYH